MTADGFRRLALSLPGVLEGSHMGHPDFRANGRIFASLHAGDRTGMVKLMPDEQAQVVRDHPKVFGPSAGAWGRQGCTNVTLAPATESAVRAALLMAYELATAKPPAKPARARTLRAGRSKAR